MNLAKRVADWLETHWVTPAYSGWLLSSLSLFFFMAATNTLTGWLYVISGIGFALLAIAAALSERTLRRLRVSRTAIAPVSVGDALTVELLVENGTQQPKGPLQINDLLPYVLGQPARAAIETIPPRSMHRWTYYLPTQRRGVYRWQAVQLRTAAPLGLFWCRRAHTVKATAVVYPTVFPLKRCPLVDEMGRDSSLQVRSDRRSHYATEGITRSLRPYRWGDPIRLVHWRTSARYGNLRVRELEVFTGEQELIIALDSALPWQTTASVSSQPTEAFEQAVIAAASLYFYASHSKLNVKLWTAGTGLIQGGQVVLETLAAVNAGEEAQDNLLPDAPIVWLTQNPDSLSRLPSGSRWVLWAVDQSSQSSVEGRSSLQRSEASTHPGLVITANQPLETQLQSTLGR